MRFVYIYNTYSTYIIYIHIYIYIPDLYRMKARYFPLVCYSHTSQKHTNHCETSVGTWIKQEIVLPYSNTKNMTCMSRSPYVLNQ